MTAQVIEAIKENEGNDESDGDSDSTGEILQPDERGPLLLARRVLHTNIVPTISQRESLFETRCTIRGKLCSLVIDSGSFTNVASTYLVEKLGLATQPHQEPHDICWLSPDSKLRINKQALVSFSISKSYTDQALCDVVPMDACHLIPGARRCPTRAHDRARNGVRKYRRGDGRAPIVHCRAGLDARASPVALDAIASSAHDGRSRPRPKPPNSPHGLSTQTPWTLPERPLRPLELHHRASSAETRGSACAPQASDRRHCSSSSLSSLVRAPQQDLLNQHAASKPAGHIGTCWDFEKLMITIKSAAETRILNRNTTPIGSDK